LLTDLALEQRVLGRRSRYADDEEDDEEGSAAPPAASTVAHPVNAGLRVVEEVVEKVDDEAVTETVGEDSGTAPGADQAKWARLAEQAKTVRMDMPQAGAADAGESAGPATGGIAQDGPADEADEDEAPKNEGPLPADFYDSRADAAAAAKKAAGKKRKAADEDEVDPSEWARFQKEIHRETAASVQVEVADLQEMLQERDERLEQEQEEYLARLAALQNKKKELLAGASHD